MHINSGQHGETAFRSGAVRYIISRTAGGSSRVHHLEIRMNALLCLSLSVLGISSALSCRWIHHKFQNHHRLSLDLLEKMGDKTIEGHESINPVPYELFNHQRALEPEKQLLFVIQTLLEITDLFEDIHSVPWDDKITENFLNILHEEINGLRSCGDFKLKRNKKLHLYFRRVRQMIESDVENTGQSWEITRKRLISLVKQLQFFSFHN